MFIAYRTTDYLRCMRFSLLCTHEIGYACNSHGALACSGVDSSASGYLTYCSHASTRHSGHCTAELPGDVSSCALVVSVLNWAATFVKTCRPEVTTVTPRATAAYITATPLAPRQQLVVNGTGVDLAVSSENTNEAKSLLVALVAVVAVATIIILALLIAWRRHPRREHANTIASLSKYESNTSFNLEHTMGTIPEPRALTILEGMTTVGEGDDGFGEVRSGDHSTMNPMFVGEHYTESSTDGNSSKASSRHVSNASDNSGTAHISRSGLFTRENSVGRWAPRGTLSVLTLDATIDSSSTDVVLDAHGNRPTLDLGRDHMQDSSTDVFNLDIFDALADCEIDVDALIIEDETTNLNVSSAPVSPTLSDKQDGVGVGLGSRSTSNGSDASSVSAATLSLTQAMLEMEDLATAAEIDDDGGGSNSSDSGEYLQVDHEPHDPHADNASEYLQVSHEQANVAVQILMDALQPERPIRFSDVEEELVGIAEKVGADEHMTVAELEQLLGNADFKAFTRSYGFDLKTDGMSPALVAGGMMRQLGKNRTNNTTVREVFQVMVKIGNPSPVDSETGHASSDPSRVTSSTPEESEYLHVAPSPPSSNTTNDDEYGSVLQALARNTQSAEEARLGVAFQAQIDTTSAISSDEETDLDTVLPPQVHLV